MNVSIEQNDNNVALIGELNRHTVPSLTVKDILPFYQQSSCQLDLAKVTEVDTAGLAWLLLVIEKAHAKNCQINFTNLPQDMVKLAQLSAVDTLFTA
ncbi:STAS domain-containing protein [Thalassotalea sp. LPB0316]|uniref:STAS domain-containing protein n=1 Tax=Thalassotalea sp. LPB0316 TaxID=2769490 RepID=UPI0018670812|nr:STAS domain-containing protein [Thalassotalea sp. LPB0316]QOL26907.1 STAS domain-containing protein [Thalassotalea sp. LPB0316]